MAEYIEREALMENIEGLRIIITGLRVGKGEIAEFAIRYKNSILRAINEHPSADVAPVRHGRWERYTKNLGECSNCGYVVSIRYKFCPNCGAKMDGERKENENG